MVASICVCVCTHDRPQGLARLLGALQPQLKAQDASLVIVDNGTTAAHITTETPYYRRLHEPGLVAARNAALEQALKLSPEFIAFIDDDEVPDANWLASLVQCLQSTGAGMCFGPLRPSYAAPPPRWAEQGPFFWKTGKTYGTGNMMLRSAILPPDPSQWFQPAFAFLGGEDEELFDRLRNQGATVAVASEAWVSEDVPASRLTLNYITKTGARDGAIEVALMRQRGWGLLTRWGASLAHIARKSFYAAYHLALVWRGSWHAVAALRDMAEIAGTVKANFGGSATYYGKR